MKLKKYLVIMLLCLMTFFATACGSDNTGKSLDFSASSDTTNTTETTEEQEAASPDENTEESSGTTQMPANGSIEIGETVSVSTEYGDFEIAIMGAAKTDWEDENDSCVISLRCEINNISFGGEIWEDAWTGYEIDEFTIIKVLDAEGFSLDFYGISGPTDGQYAPDEELQIGEKGRISMPYIIGNNATYVTVDINGQGQIHVPIE